MSKPEMALAPPLIFLRPVGFEPRVALALAQAARALSEDLVRWRLPPSGMEPDAYLAPEGALGFPAVEFRESVFDTAPGDSILQLDEQGWYRGRPVCVVRGLVPNADPQAVRQAIEDDLAHGLRLLCTQLSRTRVIYELGSQVWAARRASRIDRRPGSGAPHIWQWQNARGRLLAAADTRRGSAWLMPGLEPEQLDATELVPGTAAIDRACKGFEQLPLEWLLWSFTQRCGEDTLTLVLPADAMQYPMTLRHSGILGSTQLGRHGVAVIKITEHGERTAQELQLKLGLSDASLRRVLAGLLLTRALRLLRPQPSGLKAWLGRLLARRPRPKPGNAGEPTPSAQAFTNSTGREA